MKRKILVAGLGLIGGSLAKAMKKNVDNYIIGYDVNEQSLQFAKAEKFIDEICTDFEAGVQRADIVFLAVPISETLKLMERIDDIPLKDELIVTDVSSVKGSVLEAARKMKNDKIIFIGGHPMAGSHKAGVRAAKSHLFENAIYVLTPPENCSNGHIDILKNVLKETKSHFLTLQPEEHDEMTSVISHFPHLIASSLVHQARKWEQVHPYLPELAAGGFRDITRIASSNPKMWQDIFQHNGLKMSRLLQDWINEMVTLKEFLDTNNKERMIKYLAEAKRYRDGLGEKQTRGALPSYYDVYVDIPDKPGAIASVVQLIADEQITLRNIRILEIRDDILGALRLSFTNEKDQLRAYELLRKHHYDVQLHV